MTEAAGFRVEPTYNALALIAPSGTVVSLYALGDRRRAEQDRDRLNARLPDVENESDGC